MKRGANRIWRGLPGIGLTLTLAAVIACGPEGTQPPKKPAKASPTKSAGKGPVEIPAAKGTPRLPLVKDLEPLKSAKETSFTLADFQNLTGARAEPQYGWVILFIQNAGFTVPVKALASGSYRASIFARNAKPGPIQLDIVDGDQPDDLVRALAVFSFDRNDDSLTSATEIIRLRSGIENLKIRFINDSAAGDPEDRNATVRQVVLFGPLAE